MKNYLLASILFCIAFTASAQKDSTTKTEFHVDSLAKEKFAFLSIEKQPEYPGGLKNFYQYISRNVRYPKQAKKDGVSGNVVLSFVVEKDGQLKDVKVINSVREDIDAEAIRVVSNSIKWSPGIQNGKPVRVMYRFNVNFAL
ncbi:energy transducer TonB [Pedobacter frigidisoli]|uniref:Energy transducer TonB n=1 Tax=Pedobacter frigidisoli TaxID=2530455 RepID=A0A4R0P9C7_9SPHI|nr:energy transducer TonB [Pedobacter frigidisoli]TCD12702.1 energy transducer TonB [Pedobacter frigidisoli]